MFKPGTQLGRYRVIKPVGRGKPDGLFEVEDDAKNKFALRSPIADLEDDNKAQSVCARFRPDLESLKSIVHLNLVPLFEVVIDSSEVGIRKPDPRIYRLALERLGAIDPARSVFLDDYAGNVDAARRVGMLGIVVEADPAPALAELDRLLDGDGVTAVR